MTARKMTKTAVTTEEFETHVPSVVGMPDTGRPYIRESAQFEAYVLQKKRDAEKEVEALDIEISRLQTEIEGRLVREKEVEALDIEISRLQSEIEGRLVRKQDLMTIVIKADTILNMQDITPKLKERANG